MSQHEIGSGVGASSDWQAPLAQAWQPLPPQLPYRSSHKVWAASITMVAGVALMGLSGCFLIGILAMTSNIVMSGGPLPVLSSEAYSLKFYLYVLGLVFCIGGISLVGIGLRWMARIMK